MHPTRIPAWATERGRRLNYFPAIDPKTTALIVIDLQNAFMVDGQADGKFERPAPSSPK